MFYIERIMYYVIWKNIFGKEVYTYDNNRNKASSVLYIFDNNGDGKILNRDVFEYDEYHNQTLHIRYDDKGNVDMKITTEYLNSILIPID